MYFGHKHVETVPNCSHELATFLKYHMSLMAFFLILTKNIHFIRNCVEQNL